ncbi:hypothetical protein [Virgibacillus sp. DJP39]|uniref:hypothetical protein n=1 Tax=Virgibacillus sp. DJP39 TaxID=3409790 RepID=UPI003BB66D9E
MGIYKGKKVLIFQNYEELKIFFNKRKNLYDLIFGEVIFSVQEYGFSECVFNDRITVTRKNERIDKGDLQLTYVDIDGYKNIKFYIKNRKITNILVGDRNNLTDVDF